MISLYLLLREIYCSLSIEKSQTDNAHENQTTDYQIKNVHQSLIL